MSSSTRSLISDADLRRGRNRLVYRLVLGALAAAFALAFIFPLYWMFSGALKSPQELVQPVPTLLPQEWRWSTFADAWERLQVGHFLANTAYYAFFGWLIQLLVDVAAAYALSKLRPVFGKVVLGAMLASLMLPAAALLVPSYLTVVDVPIVGLNLIDSPWALWLPGAANAFNIYVLKRFFDQIPDDLLEAASIDGAGRLRTLWNVILPLSLPVLAVISIFAIIGSWKDFLWPLLVLQDPQEQTISVALSRLSFTGQVPQNELYAALAMASIPMIVVFMIFQRRILNGLSAGAIKG
ncbi:sugar ABC transporter permease [Catellatospora sp. TT07R-123]|uniref:carbohydrate ABC transporter permease n=1 Tax=Catellatospora sp. TT07R-123 TaxID=2733863 RepID=UPI001B12D8E3|nr:carbohydrate ABC transporter permease [Catellatospora sp. TT07R-123]GHJ44616.1 sugar ABC transporter permease [Catellatospora sp. TT07R-123]